MLARAVVMVAWVALVATVETVVTAQATWTEVDSKRAMTTIPKPTKSLRLQRWSGNPSFSIWLTMYLKMLTLKKTLGRVLCSTAVGVVTVAQVALEVKGALVVKGAKGKPGYGSTLARMVQSLIP